MIFSKFDKKIIFIIGSGRSGTHLLGRTFANNKEIDAFIEDKEFFEPITNLAVGIDKEKKNLTKIFKKYKKVFRKSKRDYILEKTHPNIWFVEEILEFFPDSKFIGIKRDVYGTVSSMLNHKGVLSWYEKLPLDEINPFLGIDDNNLISFKDLPIEVKCVHRWISHTNRLEYLKNKFPENVMVISYENFYDNYNVLMEQLKNFLKIDFDLNAEPLNVSGKDKWKENLTESQIINIDKTISKNV